MALLKNLDKLYQSLELINQKIVVMETELNEKHLYIDYKNTYEQVDFKDSKIDIIIKWENRNSKTKYYSFFMNIDGEEKRFAQFGIDERLILHSYIDRFINDFDDYIGEKLSLLKN